MRVDGTCCVVRRGAHHLHLLSSVHFLDQLDDNEDVQEVYHNAEGGEEDEGLAQGDDE